MQPTWSSHNNSGNLLHCCRCRKKPLLLMLLQLLPGRRNRAVPAHSNTNAEGTLLNHLVTDCTPSARLVKTYHARKAAPRMAPCRRPIHPRGPCENRHTPNPNDRTPVFFFCAWACFSSAAAAVYTTGGADSVRRSTSASGCSQFNSIHRFKNLRSFGSSAILQCLWDVVKMRYTD